MSGHGRTTPGRDARIWREGYAACLRDLRALDESGSEHGAGGGGGQTLATLVEWMRRPEATARLAWRRATRA